MMGPWILALRLTIHTCFRRTDCFMYIDNLDARVLYGVVSLFYLSWDNRLNYALFLVTIFLIILISLIFLLLKHSFQARSRSGEHVQEAEYELFRLLLPPRDCVVHLVLYLTPHLLNFVLDLFDLVLQSILLSAQIGKVEFLPGVSSCKVSPTFRSIDVRLQLAWQNLQL